MSGMETWDKIDGFSIYTPAVFLGRCYVQLRGMSALIKETANKKKNAHCYFCHTEIMLQFGNWDL